MKLSGRDFAKTPTSVFSAEVVCPWCDRTASIDIGPQHRYGRVDYHCQKCGKFSSHTVKTADQWFEQHQEKLRKEREVWKRIPPEAYVTCRRSSTSGASFVYTLYTGKGSPTEYLSRDSVEHVLIEEFGMSWEQANALLISAGLGSHGGQRIYLRQLTKISAALEERKLKGKTEKFSRGDTVKINDREALFLRYSNEGFAVVAFPGVGDAEVPVVDLEVIDTGASPAEVGFGDFLMDSPQEEMLEAETTDTVLSDVQQITEHVREVAEHEKMEGGEEDEAKALEEAAEHLEDAAEALEDFVGEEFEEAGEEVEEHAEEHGGGFEDEHGIDEAKEEKEKEARRLRADVREKLRTLYNIINDPNTDPATLQEAQRQWNMLKRQQPQPQVARQPLAKKTAWWYKAPWELEHSERPDHKNQTFRYPSVADQSDLFPKENELYPEYATTENPKENDGSLERSKQDVSEYSHEKTPIYTANRAAQQKVHQAFNRSGDLKKAITFYRNDLSIADIRDLVRFYQASGKLASHEADEIATWFIGTKPRLLSARQIRGVITGSPGSYSVKSEEGKNLGGPYKTREQAKKRLKQVEYFKHKGLSKKTAQCTCEGAYDPYCPDHGAREQKRGSERRWEETKGMTPEQKKQWLKDEEATLEKEKAEREKGKKALSKRALLDKGMGIFQPAVYRGREVLVIAVDNTGNRATVEDGQHRQFQVDVADLTPTKTGPYSGKSR